MTARLNWNFAAALVLSGTVAFGCGGQIDTAAPDGGGAVADARTAACARESAAYLACEAALVAATSCDPRSGASQCPGGTVTDVGGCMHPANADQKSRATLVAAIADYQAAVGECGIGVPGPPGCAGFPGGTSVTCVPTGDDAGTGVCGYR